MLAGGCEVRAGKDHIELKCGFAIVSVPFFSSSCLRGTHFCIGQRVYIYRVWLFFEVCA